METILLREVIEAVQGTLMQGSPDYQVKGVSTDSRTAAPGQLFIPLVGERFDAHDFIPQAVQNGVRAVIVGAGKKGWSSDLHVIQVEDTLKALQSLAGCYRRKFDIPIIAVTGSTGKTTTKDMIHSVLSTRYNVLKTEGNYNNEIGLPLTLFNLSSQHEMAVVEMGMSGFGEIHRLAQMADPCAAVITNIGVSHIEKLGSRENILKAKQEIFDYFLPEYVGILNGDDNLLNSLGDELPFNVVYFGLQEGNDYRADKIETRGEEGISYSMNTAEEACEIRLTVPGRHNVYNSLAAAAVGRHFGMDMADIRKGLANFRMGKMRMHVIRGAGGIRIIDDVYNASPDSMKAALATLREFEGIRKIAILGDMLEMGDYAERGHREVGQAAADNEIDILITKGVSSRFIAEQAMQRGMDSGNVYHCSSNTDVIDLLETLVEDGDTILVKGSRGMKMEEVVSFLQERRD